MSILKSSQTDMDIQALERAATNTTLALQSTILTLNNAHSALWSLPDERLINVLQALLDAGRLQEVFTMHYTAATALNQAAEAAGSDLRAIAEVGRKFTVTALGKVELVVPPAPAAGDMECVGDADIGSGDGPDPKRG